jgi:group I intron endonuclease
VAQNKGYKVIKGYVNSYTPMIVECLTCGTTRNPTWHTLKNHLKPCKHTILLPPPTPIPPREKYKETNLRKRQMILDKLTQRGCTIVDKNLQDRWADDTYVIVCKHNHEPQPITHQQIMSNQGLSCCSTKGRQERAISRTIEILKKHNIKMIGEYVNSTTPIKLRCNKCTAVFTMKIMGIKYSKTKTLCYFCRFGINQKEVEFLESLSFENTPITGTIYKITGPTGKVYIGQTTRPFRIRYNRHKTAHLKPKSSGYKTQLAYAFRKHGFENFQWEILHEDIPWDKLSELEIQEIKNYDSYNNGYNCTNGGRSGLDHIRAIKARYERMIEKKKLKEMKLLIFQKRKEEKKRLMAQKRFLKSIKKGLKKILKLQKHEEYKATETLRRSNSARQKFIHQRPDTSQYRGVFKQVYPNGLVRYSARIKHKKKQIRIGWFDDEIEAAKAYDAKAIQLLGASAITNFKY